MTDTEIRLGLVAGVTLVVVLAVWLVRRFIERQRRLVIAASLSKLPADIDASGVTGPVRILAFSSDDCRQCHTLQEPALQRAQAARGDNLHVTTVDAPSAPDLVEQYRVLTLPTTIVLDAAGRVHAVNYGFANTEQLLKQIDKAIVTNERAHVAASSANA